MKISVIGCGRWGTFIAWYLDNIGHKVTLYGRKESLKFQELKKTYANEFLELPKSIYITSSVEKAFENRYIIICISSQQLREFLARNKNNIKEDSKIILCMKGIESTTGKTLTQVISEILPNHKQNAIWVGPGHVQDFVAGIPNCMVIDSTNEALKEELSKSFSSDLIRIYLGTDLIGNEIGSATKNIMGIAAGILDALSLSSLKGPLMSRGTYEIGKLIVAMGGRSNTVYGMSHLGDYQTTLFSTYSNNWRYGNGIIKGINNTKLSEGVETTKAIIRLAEAYDVDMPICESIYEVIYNQEDPMKLINTLMTREIKQEI